MDVSKPETNERMTCVLMCRDIWELWESEKWRQSSSPLEGNITMVNAH